MCLTIEDGIFAVPIVCVARDFQQTLNLKRAARAAFEAEDGIDVVCRRGGDYDRPRRTCCDR